MIDLSEPNSNSPKSERIGERNLKARPHESLSTAAHIAGAVSWGAVIAGAAAAAALSLILLILGVGFGLSSISPWTHEGISATSFGVSTILWLTLTQLLASGMGGYLAGRMRVRWLNTHADEVYFRDTAHGFLTWSVATLATAMMLTSAIGSIISTGTQAGATVAVAAGAAALAKPDDGSLGYFTDALFRTGIAPIVADSSSASSADTAGQSIAESRAEVVRIFSNSIRTGALPEEDLHYVAQLVARRTGMTQLNAEQRVAEIYTRVQAKLAAVESSAKELADKGRKTSSYTALWLFVSLLGGAFVASLSAIFGGRQRDQ